MESSELLRLLTEAVTNQAEAVPAGWLTADQWGKQWNRSRQHSKILLDKGVELGIVESRVFRVINTTNNANRPYPTKHYREIK